MSCVTRSTLKVFKRGSHEEELSIYNILQKTNSRSFHQGREHVRTALDIFILPRAGGDHTCLVQKPMWDSFRDLLTRNPTHRFTTEMLKSAVPRIFLALDYLHTECKIVHTDIKADNILIELADIDLLENFVQDEIASPPPREFVGGIPIYASRRFGLPKQTGEIVISYIGSAVRGDERQIHDVQPDVYRCLEVMLKTEWSYSADIWNVGAMIWDIYEDKHLFYGIDPDGSGYTTRAHLAEVVAILGHPPVDLLERGTRSKEFFDEKAHWTVDIPIPHHLSLKTSESNLEGIEQEKFLEFVRCMLQ